MKERQVVPLKVFQPAELALLQQAQKDMSDTVLVDEENGEQDNLDKCGIAGVYDRQGDVAVSLESMLLDLNHRGQEGAGGALVDENGNFFVFKGSGLVREVIDADHDVPVFPAVVSRKQLQAHKAIIAVGQTRYSTAGSENEEALQPFVDKKKGFSLAHNGNLVNVDQLLQLIPKKKRDEALSDSWVAHQAILAAKGETWGEKIARATSQFEGAYSLIMSSGTQLFGVRDPWGFKPLMIGQLPNGSYILASESSVLEDLRAKFVRDVKRGEGVVIDENGVNTFFTDLRREMVRGAFCSFEYFYIARPDSYINGRSIGEIRQNAGARLAMADKKAGFDFSNAVVVGVQDSGNIYANGYSYEAHVQPRVGLVRNHYARNGHKRLFQGPNAKERVIATNFKHEVDPFAVEGKDVILIDDSIVRGTTILGLIHKLRNAYKAYPGLQGPKSIHVRIAFPQIKHPCYYGVDFSRYSELVDPSKIGADSLRYLSVHELGSAITGEELDPSLSEEEVFAMLELCGHCVTGVQPVAVREEGLMRKKPERWKRRAS